MNNRDRQCKVARCETHVYARSLCRHHYEQDRRGIEPYVPVPPEEGPCKFEGCKRQIENFKQGLCRTHGQQLTTLGYCKPLLDIYYTENGRICRRCGVEKSEDEYYKRSTGKLVGLVCKTCCIERQTNRRK